MYRTLHKLRKDRALDLFVSIKNFLKKQDQNPDDFFYIFPMGNYGEHTYILGHLHSLRKRGRVCLVLNENKSWLAKFFPESFDYCVTLPDSTSDLYEELFEISYLALGFPYVVWTDIFCNGRLNSELIRHGRLTISESYAFALELPLRSELKPLKIKKEAITLGQDQKNYILLMPDSTTVKKLDKDFWISLYRELEARSLNPILDDTFLNWNIMNIKSVRLVKDDLIKFFNESCVALIGIRSGMLDLIGGMLTEDVTKRLISIMPVDSDDYNPAGTGLNVAGISKYAGIFPCWGSKNIIDLEVDLRDRGYQVVAAEKIIRSLCET
jgi:hypothetical protein